MEKVISVSVGEVALKGQNRKFFEDSLTRNIKRAIRDIGYERVYKDQGKFYIVGKPEDYPDIIRRVKKVFGIVYVSLCYVTDCEYESIKETVTAFVEDCYGSLEKTFKIQAKRTDKRFPIRSQELNMELGGLILERFPNFKVEVHQPEVILYLDIKQRAYVYSEREEGYGGLPVGTSGKGTVLLSGGIDSPVAMFLMAKRGLKLNAVHFHSYPFTSERGEQKVIDLASTVSRYIGAFSLFSVNLLGVQKAINEKCDEKFMTLLSRRFMMRIAERIAVKGGSQCLITGESLGQVASQTVEGLNATNRSVSLPVFRPLIAYDKVDIIAVAKEIETFDISIEPFEDCCTVFLPKHPITRPSLEEVVEAESVLDVESLIELAMSTMKHIEIS